VAEKKFYWLKLKRDFFKRHDIRIIEEMPNGKEYILFYLKLLLESIDHEGSLRFSETVPYDEQMLSVITNTNIDVVRSAMKMFIGLNMIEIFDDQTIYMSEVDKLIGSETKWAEKKRIQRAKEDNVPLLSSNCPIEIEKEKETDTEKETKTDYEGKSKKRFTKPTLEEVQAYCQERNNNVDAQRWFDYYSSNGWKVGKNSMKDWKACVRTWERSADNGRKNNSKPSVQYGYPDEC
jgi:predicted phage replisome organizer